MSDATKEIISNRKAFFDYEVLEKFEVGVQLVGTEIKSLRINGGSLQDAFVSIEHGEMWLINSSIPQYSFGSYCNHEERRKRKLLAHKREIRRINAAIQEKGLTCIPLALFLRRGYAKLSIALAKGKKLHDKRESIKAREDKKAMDRLLKNTL
jgi:SsrA-binding protein